jgi:ATP-dependent DNA helicase RecQ
MRHIIDVLRGANTRKIRDYSHNLLSTYGIGKDYSIDEWAHLGRSLVQQKLVDEGVDGMPILKLNTHSREILRGERTVSIPALRKPEVAAKSVRSTVSLDPASILLFHHLRVLRKQLADAQGVAPYVVFPDTSLQAMADQRPSTRERFAQIPGVGKSKLENYFEPFSSAIQSYCKERGLEVNIDVLPEENPASSDPSARKSSSRPSSVFTRSMVLQLYQQGCTIEQISHESGRAIATVVNYLCLLIEDGESIDIKPLIQPGHYDVIAEAMHRTGDQALRPIKDELGDEYPYGELHLVRATLRAKRKLEHQD